MLDFYDFMVDVLKRNEKKDYQDGRKARMTWNDLL